MLVWCNKNKDECFCVVYGEINGVDAYLMAWVNKLPNLRGPAQFFRRLDLTKNYWQILLSLKSNEDLPSNLSD